MLIDDGQELFDKAYKLVAADPTVIILEPLHLAEDGNYEFRCRVAVNPHPNSAGLPPHAELRVELDDSFPLRAVDVFVESPEIQGFPHQDAETGKLCLFPDREAPFDENRLRVYIDWARQWLADAATGNLLCNGDPYELPDFSRRSLRNKLASDRSLLSDEDSHTYLSWITHIGKTGVVELATSAKTRGYLICQFLDADKKVIRRREYPEEFIDEDRVICGRWILLPNLVFRRHRPPQSHAELESLCKPVGIDLWQVIRKAWEEDNKDPEVACVLVGYPIPRVVGEEPSEIHWQPLYYFNRREAARQYERDRRKTGRHLGRIKTGTLWNAIVDEGALAPGSPLPWGKIENIARGRLYARGGLSTIAKADGVVVAGCGAIGSVVAELLARGGAPNLTLFDGDSFELGNQCRHTLDGRDLGYNKALALASRLQGGNPLSVIKGFGAHLPLLSGLDEEVVSKAAGALDRARLLIDCTTDEGAFRWLNSLAKSSKARFASMFVNFRSEVLTLCISGKTTSCRKVCRKLYRDIIDGKTPIGREQYDATPAASDLVLPGAGCWHPTFPAANAHLWMLTSTAMNLLDEVLKEPIGTDGIGLLIRRNGDLLSGGSKPIVEIIWNRRYR